jgi:hypothetical protein
MQLPSLTNLKSRLRDRMDASARGSDVPAGIDRGADAVAPSGARERGRMRRRLRELRRLREAQLLELGALVLEAHKHGRDDSPAIKTKAAEAATTDAEARAAAEALDTDAGLDTVMTAGIAGPCPMCGTLTSTSWRFCSTCGTPLDGRPDAAPRADQSAEPTPLADARSADPTYGDAPAAEPVVSDAPAPERVVSDATAAEPVVSDAPATDSATAEADADADAPTTELHTANGNGAAHEELKATRGDT